MKLGKQCDYLKIICPINDNFHVEEKECLANALYMLYIGIKTINFIYAKAFFPRRNYFRKSLLKRNAVGISVERKTSVYYEQLQATKSFSSVEFPNGKKELKRSNSMDQEQSFTYSDTDAHKAFCHEVNASDRKKTRKRPNFFVAIQITDQKIHTSVKQIQEHILLQDKRLEKSMISRSTLHITLEVMHLKDSEDHSKAMKALSAVHQEYNATMCKEPLQLEFSGIGHFGNRVVYAKVKENSSYRRLCDLAKSVHRHLETVGVRSTDTRKEFNPHLTIAKLDFTKKSLKAIKKIPPSLYQEFIDLQFGYDTVKSIQLLRMSGPKTSSGYYFGDELFFSFNDPIIWKKLNSLLAIAEKKKEIRNKISKITKKLLE